MKLLVLAALLLIFDVDSLSSRFKSLKCVSLNESVVFHNCFIKPYSRNYSTINFALTTKFPIEVPMKVDVMIKYRYGTIFRQIFHAEIDWCDVIGQANENKLVMKMAALIRESIPNIFKPCPQPPARFDIVNMTFNDNLWLVPIPQGLYRHEYTLTDRLFIAFNIDTFSDVKTSW